MQSSSESGRVAYCLPVGITSSKTKCVRLRNGRSLQHPKQISARVIVDATGRTILVLCSYIVCTRNCAIALYKNFPQNVLVSSSFWSPRKQWHGPCRSCSNSIKVTWRVELRCDAVFMTWSPSSSPRFWFSLLAVIVRTTLNEITSRRFQQHLQKEPLCSGIMLHLFIFTYSPAFAIP